MSTLVSAIAVKIRIHVTAMTAVAVPVVTVTGDHIHAPAEAGAHIAHGQAAISHLAMHFRMDAVYLTLYFAHFPE